MTEIKSKQELCTLILEMLDVHPDYVKAYRDKQKLTEFVTHHGFGYWAGSEHDATIQKMQEDGFEPFAILTGTYRIGCDVAKMTSYLCVTQEDVDHANTNIRAGEPPLMNIFDKYEGSYGILAFVKGFEDEYGSVGVQGIGGGLRRTF